MPLIEKTPRWEPPKIWPKATVFILGGGPSLREVNFDLIEQYRCIGVNNAYTLGSWVDLVYFGDEGWYTTKKDPETGILHKEQLMDFPGLKVTCAPCAQFIYWPGVKRFARGRSAGIDTRPGYVAWCGNSGASAINVAWHLGAKRVVLLGFDMKKVKGENNWHEDHFYGANDPYPGYLEHFKVVAKDAERLKFEIINTTPSSALTLFPFKTIEEVVGECPI